MPTQINHEIMSSTIQNHTFQGANRHMIVLHLIRNVLPYNRGLDTIPHYSFAFSITVYLEWILALKSSFFSALFYSVVQTRPCHQGSNVKTHIPHK